MRVFTVLLAAALTVMIPGCNRDATNSAGKPDTELYSYLPPDATFIAGVRMSHMRSSPVYARLRDGLPQEALPYEKEATEMVISTDGVHMLILARGKFDKKRIERDFKDSPVTFLRDDLIAIGPAAGIESAKRRGGSALAGNIPSDADIWAVTNGHIPIALPERSNLQNLTRISQDLKLATASFHVSDTIRGEMQADFNTDKAAEQMKTALRGFIGLARLSTPDGKQDLLKVLDGIQIEQDKARVNLKADWSRELTNTILNQLPARPGTSRQ